MEGGGLGKVVARSVPAGNANRSLEHAQVCVAMVVGQKRDLPAALLNRSLRLLPPPAPQDGKFELGKLRGGKQDDITVICAYVVDESAH